MFKNLRSKYIMISMSSLALGLLLLILLVETIVGFGVNNRYNGYLTVLCSHQGTLPDYGKTVMSASEEDFYHYATTNQNNLKSKGRKKTVYRKSGFLLSFFFPEFSKEASSRIRYFSATNDVPGEFAINQGNVNDLNTDAAVKLCLQVLNSKKDKGTIGTYKFRVHEYVTGEKLLVFIDWENGKNEIKGYLYLMILFSGLLWIMVLIPVYILSGRVVRPIEANIKRQKQFITDAGHELKTPLAIISTDAEMIEIEEGESEWTESIHNQLKRMTDLIQNMLLLARLDENYKETIWEPVPFGSMVMEYVEQFIQTALSQGKYFTCDVNEEAVCYGNEQRLSQIITILLDNAVKYADGEEIKVFCDIKKDTLIFSTKNVSEGLCDSDIEHIFDRFYRPDSSRNRNTGGSGIGLSSAKAIVSLHRGSLTASLSDKIITFEAKIPIRESNEEPLKRKIRWSFKKKSEKS